MTLIIGAISESTKLLILIGFKETELRWILIIDKDTNKRGRSSENEDKKTKKLG